ncbi:MAG: hypothetical protein ACRDTG_02070 [Pseudonocardiaceae bacterium]
MREGGEVYNQVGDLRPARTGGEQARWWGVLDAIGPATGHHQ